MARNYLPNMLDYGISKKRYIELKYKALQYPEWLRNRQECYELNVTASDGMPHGSSGSTSTTEHKADMASKYSELIAIVDDCIKEAVKPDSNIADYLRKSVCFGVPFHHLGVPAGKNKFSKYRRKFFYLLDQKVK